MLTLLLLFKYQSKLPGDCQPAAVEGPLRPTLASTFDSHHRPTWLGRRKDRGYRGQQLAQSLSSFHQITITNRQDARKKELIISHKNSEAQLYFHLFWPQKSPLILIYDFYYSTRFNTRKDLETTGCSLDFSNLEP